MTSSAAPLVAIVMGSRSDWDVMKSASDTLDQLGVPHDVRIMSAHRTPALVQEFIGGAEERGVEVVIAAAGGAAHLAGVCAAHTPLPVLGVPMTSGLDGLDSLLSTVQMPAAESLSPIVAIAFPQNPRARTRASCQNVQP